MAEFVYDFAQLSVVNFANSIFKPSIRFLHT